MQVKRFGVRVAADPRRHAVIAIPFDPDQAWGGKTPSGGRDGQRLQVRVPLMPFGGGWAFTMNPAGMRHAGIVNVKLAAEYPQRGDLAGDIAAMLEANPAAVTFFGVLARFSGKASTMWRWSR